MKKITLSILGLGLFASSVVFGQVKQINRNNVREGEKVEYCHSHNIENEQLKSEEYRNFRAAFETEIQQIIAEQKKNPQKRGTVYTIPIVFHILHNGGAENISQDQILDGMRILAEDFRLLNADANTVHNDFKRTNPNATCIPTDAEIQFVLATKAPDGTEFPGFTRTKSTLTNVTSSAQGGQQLAAVRAGNDVFKGQWPGNKYLNILVANNIGGAAGYARYPAGATNTGMDFNTIFLLHNYLGSIGTSSPYTSRALTHEIGHWLNLAHTWGSNNDPMVACDTDNVPDTPETRGTSTCNLNENFCGPRANVENFMDYSYCSKMFSGGQVARMRAALTSTASGRNNTWSATNLASVGGNKLLALFRTSSLGVCKGGEIKFTDRSYNSVVSWNWTFTGANIASSTERDPKVVFTSTGVQTARLIVSNGTTTDTATVQIRVFPNPVKIPFLEGFENTSTIGENLNWVVDNNANNAAWEITNTAAKSGNKSIKLNNFEQGKGDVDELSSTSWDLSSIPSTEKVTLSFRYAYRKKVTTNGDYLKVFLSSDCGNTWDQRRTMRNSSLSDLATEENYTPVEADWITVHMTNVSSSYFVNGFRFKFRFESDGGNNIYLDDINLYGGTPSDNLIASSNEIASAISEAKVYPNPTEGDINVVFDAAQQQTVNVSVIDMLGNIVNSYSVNANQGVNSVELSTSELSSGMYMVRLANGGTTKNIQFVVR